MGLGAHQKARYEKAIAFLSLAARARSFALASRAKAIADDAETVPGWVRGPSAWEVAARSLRLPGRPTIVEVGVFMGRSTVLLAAARRLAQSGKVFCVDPFDCSGDDYSVPFYRKELEQVGVASLEDTFRHNISIRGLEPWVEVLKGHSADIVADWTRPIDLLLLDGDHSPRGAREIYALWSPFLKPGGQIILHNTGERSYAEGHDGNYRISASDLTAPPYKARRQILYTTYATKSG